MARLKSRQKFIPGGFQFVQPETQWRLPVNQSFDVGVMCIVNHRIANPHLARVHGWATDPDAVAEELDLYNTRICEVNGWTDYIQGGEPTALPKVTLPRPTRHPLANVAAGGETLVEWIKSGAEAVPSSLSDARAMVCRDCPKNGKGGLERFFTQPVAEAIRAAVSSRSGMKLSTPYDDLLNVCTACSCPLKLKVHLPLSQIISKMDPSVMTQLDRGCWILSESNK